MKTSIKLLINFIILVVCFPLVDALIFSEIMYHPKICGDSYCEWIEVHNDDSESINLSEWKICGQNLLSGYVKRNGEIGSDNGVVLYPGKYAVITDGGSGTEVYDNFNVDSNSVAVHTSASSLCGGLSNSGEEISLEKGTDIVKMSYDTNFGGNGDNNSLQFVNGWCNGIPTAGKENSCLQIEQEEAQNFDNQTQQENNTIENKTNSDNNKNNGSNNLFTVVNCENISVVKIKEYPPFLKFGSSGEVSIEFNASCYEWGSVNFLVYGSSERVISYENGDKIRKYASCENGTIFEDLLEKDYEFKIKFFTEDNCDGSYNNGEYPIALKVCRPLWEKYYEQLINIKLDGKNSTKCDDNFKSENEYSEEANEDLDEETVYETGNAVKDDIQDNKKTSSYADTSTPKSKTVYESKAYNSKKISVYLLGMLLMTLIAYFVISKENI